MRKKNSIIIIEDDQDDQLIIQEALSELNIKNDVIFFDACDKAYNHLMSVEDKPFLIICDINLPGMNGIELKQRIDATDLLRKKAIPFIFLTTADQQQMVDQAYRITNLQGYFKKGITMQEIRQQLNFIIGYWATALHPYR
ncbi:MAG TPA: response regulator [Flavisolibacter sp.]|nr:response regulator [Flavisolibacter sp.]